VRRFLVIALLALPVRAGAELEVVPKIGADFEHFGETYRITADKDTVTTNDDYGTLGGLLIRTPGYGPTHFNLDLEGYAGHSTRRAGALLDGSLKRGSDLFQLRQEAWYRSFTDNGDYTMTGDHLEEELRASWQHRFSPTWSVRLRDAFDGTWYQDPDQYNLTSWTHEPRAELAFDFGETGSHARAGYRFAKRDVPDSTTLGYRRHGADADLTCLFGETTCLEIAETLSAASTTRRACAGARGRIASTGASRSRSATGRPVVSCMRTRSFVTTTRTTSTSTPCGRARVSK
jgi:hypothetical protein